VVVIAGPTKDLLEEEKEPLYTYLKNGGRALFLLEPDTPDSFRELLGKWAISLGEGTVVDQGSSIRGDPKTPVLQSFQYSTYTPITDLLDVTFFPGATSVSFPMEEPPDTIAFLPLAVTSPNSWLETDADKVAYDEGKDTKGPLFVALAVQAVAPVGEEPGQYSDKLTTMVIFGDTDLASNKFYSAFTNSDFLLNSINWLAEDYELISIRVKPFIFRELVVTSREFDFIRWTSWLLMPSAVIFLGFVVWWRRR